MIRNQLILDVHDELIVDNFAGGGGASMGIELALGRHVDIAINHDPLAVALHSANHPQTYHHCEDVFKVDPIKATGGRPVGLAWFSPDCKHFSKAKGGKPRSKKIRGLAWIVIKWARLVKPRVIILENVEEFQSWGPLLKDGQPCPKRKGNTFKYWVRKLRWLGYEVDWKQLRACDYGAPTIRNRLYLIARRDGRPICWPHQSHADPNSDGFSISRLKPWRTAAECIDWSLPCPSIFLTPEEAKRIGVKRPLAEATQRRIARGIKKFVLEAKEPFIVQYHSAKRSGDDRVSSINRPLGTQTAENRFGLGFLFVTPLTHQGSDRVESVGEPFRVITGAHRGEKALTVPFTVGAGGPARQGEPRAVDKSFQTILTRNDQYLAAAVLSDANRPLEARNASPAQPMRTQMAEVKGGHFQLVQAFLAKHFGGHETPGAKLGEPISTITAKDHHGLVASHLSKLYGTSTGQATGDPIHTITGQGQHIAEVRAFLQKYYSHGGQDQCLTDPMHTIPCEDRFGLVTVEGVQYQISDIGMRMLVARELYRGQGFPETYVIDIYVDVVDKRGRMKRKALSGEAQVRMCGNSVCPPVAEALVAANVPEMAEWRNGELKSFKRRLSQGSAAPVAA